MTGKLIVLLLLTLGISASAQTTTVSLNAANWEATDSVRSESHLGRPSIYINRGVALARDLTVDNGIIEYDVAATGRTTFLGVAFRAMSPRFSEVVLLRPGESGTTEALQYAPAFNAVAAAWQVYHGREYNAAVAIPRERWIHVRLELDDATARIYFDTATKPTLVVSRIAGSGGSRLGVWTGAAGRGAYFSNIRIHRASGGAMVAGESQPQPPGVITDWELSNTVEPAAFHPTSLPDLGRLTWQRVRAEVQGFVLVNRYREQPGGYPPFDERTGTVLADSVMTGKAEGSSIVYGRTTIESPKDEIRRLQFMYSDGIVIYLNGRPLVFAMNPPGLRDDLGIMSRVGDALYLPLHKGRNDLVVASIEYMGGWAFGARLDAP